LLKEINMTQTHNPSSPRALIIMTSHSELGDTGNKTGFYWEEMAAPYWQFVDAGFDVTLASIDGGEPPADPNSIDSEQLPEAVRRFMNDDDAMSALKHTAAIDDVSGNDFDTIFLPGGHGAMWDAGSSRRLAKLVAQAYEHGVVIGAVCHGPAGLINATLSNGDPLVKGKRVNGFTDAEEEAAGLTDIVPFLLETKLGELGGDFECNKDNFNAYAVQDGNLITGQNPASSVKVGRLIVDAVHQMKVQAA